ncbi:MAG: DUF1566 domain-containing protein, partial [Candidatus Electrothrix sp. LOE1_4_5]|nr:DUF1566 domain-containing protein [Candidatus Electrothrix gigas]
GSLAPLWSLQKLDLSHNRIKNEVSVLELNKLSDLQVLKLSHNGMSKFPGTELPVQNLQLLDLSHNDLTEIPYVAMNALRIWDLQGNGSVRLADDYGDLFSLKSIKKLQYDSGSDYDNLSKLPEGLRKKLEGIVARENKRLQKIACPEGSRRIGQYVDNCNGTISDTKTGLMWKRCSEGLSGMNCENGKRERYEWKNAVRRFKNVEYAGYKDWRLPTIDELKTLVYCSNGVKNTKNGKCDDSSEKPAINQQAFPNTLSNKYWSGSRSANDDYWDYAWYVNFSDGHSGTAGRSRGSSFFDRFRNYVLFRESAFRLVRGGQ